MQELITNFVLKDLSPQMSIENQSVDESKVWILLTKHIIKNDTKIFIALHVFNDPGTRVWRKKPTIIKVSFYFHDEKIIFLGLILLNVIVKLCRF